MTPEKTAIREDERVTRLFPGRPRQLGESPFAVNDVGTSGNGFTLSADLQARLGDALEQRWREPLLRIASMAEVLKGDPNARHKDQLTEIGEASERAEGMVRDVLDFMRASAGGLKIARRRVDLKLLSERVVDAIHTRHPDRPMLFLSDPRIEGSWDPDRMATLLTKLVVNAIDHGSVRPAIRVELQGSQQEATLRVWNAGCLALMEPPSRAFEPFVSGPARAGSVRAGLGLGLYLAREIARAHGGRIDLRSSEEEGTTVQVIVPRS